MSQQTDDYKRWRLRQLGCQLVQMYLMPDRRLLAEKEAFEWLETQPPAPTATEGLKALVESGLVNELRFWDEMGD